MTKNPSCLLPEIPEGKVKLEQLNNYTKNPLLVKVFHELSWVEDMGSGIINISRYAPLYNSSYNVEILNGSHFIFSITYVEMSLQNDGNVLTNQEMSDKLKVNERTIHLDIDKLSSIIEHVGPNKGGYWKVNK